MPLTLPTSGALHFSSRGEYGVRLMVELARHHGDGPVSLSEMADHEELPRPYLEQLVVSLREAGLVTSTRGAHGGYELAVAPERIRMSQVVAGPGGARSPRWSASPMARIDAAHVRAHGVLQRAACSGRASATRSSRRSIR